MKTQIRIKELKIENYRLIFGNEGGKSKDKPTLKFGKVLSTGKNKGTFKQIWGYYYNKVEDRDLKAELTYNNVKANLESELKAKEVLKSRINDFNIEELKGKVFYTSWGYDQTNVDFYQVMDVTKKMAVVRKITQSIVEGSGGMMCCNVKPNLNDFIGNEEKKLIKVQGFGVIICNGRYNLREYTSGEKGTYCSWYA